MTDSRGHAVGQTTHDRFPEPYKGTWCMAARDDPITGLVAWPGFFERLPALLEAHLRTGQYVGIAIGDVDDLKGYVENLNARDARSFGHIAGNDLMSRLGAIARDWMHEDGPPDGCLATFGGDEIIFVAEARSEAVFVDQVSRLRMVLDSSLPRTVSFGAAVCDPDGIPASTRGDHWWREFCVHVIGRVERALFTQKNARRHHRPSLPIATISVR